MISNVVFTLNFPSKSEEYIVFKCLWCRQRKQDSNKHKNKNENRILIKKDLIEIRVSSHCGFSYHFWAYNLFMYGKESKIKRNHDNGSLFKCEKRFEISLALFVCEIRLWFKISKEKYPNTLEWDECVLGFNSCLLAIFISIL